MTVYCVPGLRGLELWNAVANGTALFELREQKSAYFAALRDVLVRLHGEAGFVCVVFCGGEAGHPLLAKTLEAAPLPFAYTIDRTGEFAARQGALRIFAEMGWQRGVALDLGQTQLKVITAASCRSIARDIRILPLGAHALDPDTGQARLRDFIYRALPVDADGVLLALPVALDSNGVAESATYPGLWGPVRPIFEDLFPMAWVVLNDAVLAAVGFRPANRQKTLVITMGYGIGGALWED